MENFVNKHTDLLFALALIPSGAILYLISKKCFDYWSLTMLITQIGLAVIQLASFILVFFISDYHKIHFKNPFKRITFWFRYKRVKELVHRECDGCCIYGTKEMFNCTKSGRTEKCLHTNKIFAKRSFNPLKWLKKLLFILVICLLFSSCSVYVNCNFNEVPKHKVTQQDSTVLRTDEYWF